MSPLVGRGIVVTRPAAQSGGLAQLIARDGGEALLFPSIAIEPLATRSFQQLVSDLDACHIAVFISRNAVEWGARKVLAARAWPAQTRVAAVGAGTRDALLALGFAHVLAPQGQADTEALLSLDEFVQVRGKRVAIFRGEGGREELADRLRSRGAEVIYAECYRRALPTTDMQPLLDAWAAGRVHAVCLSSSEGTDNFVRLLGNASAVLKGVPVFVPHPRVAEHAHRLGLRAVLAAGASDSQMHAAMVAYFSATG